MNYRRKPATITAIQFTPNTTPCNCAAVADFLNLNDEERAWGLDYCNLGNDPEHTTTPWTVDGHTEIDPGHWIVNENGTISVHDPDSFHTTYEPDNAP